MASVEQAWTHAFPKRNLGGKQGTIQLGGDSCRARPNGSKQEDPRERGGDGGSMGRGAVCGGAGGARRRHPRHNAMSAGGVPHGGLRRGIRRSQDSQRVPPAPHCTPALASPLLSSSPIHLQTTTPPALPPAYSERTLTPSSSSSTRADLKLDRFCDSDRQARAIPT
jgi:hypothetical protein